MLAFGLMRLVALADQVETPDLRAVRLDQIRRIAQPSLHGDNLHSHVGTSIQYTR